MQIIKNTLFQPIESHFVPTQQKEEAITVKEFINLLKKEEDYFKGEQHKTKLMITRLRKIFYDVYGWDQQLIRKAAKIKGRYDVKLEDNNEAIYPTKSSGGVSRTSFGFNAKQKNIVVTVKESDRQNKNAREVPEIFANDNQEVILESGLYCDLGHVLAGMDAYNNFAPVTPLPNFLLAFRFLFPCVKSNVDIVTWIGDIASSAGEFLFEYLHNKREITEEEKQGIIDNFAPGSDMLGNIDSIVISHFYNTSVEQGMKVTEMFEDYYYEGREGNIFSKKRYSQFSKLIGLKEWSGDNFCNEAEWLKYQKKQLRSNIAFYIYSRSKMPISIGLAGLVWMGFYKKILDSERLLQLFLTELKNRIKNEPD